MPKGAKLLIFGGVIAIIAILAAVVFLYVHRGGTALDPFIPFGLGSHVDRATTTPDDEGSGGILPGMHTGAEQRLFKLHDAPVSGFSIINENTADGRTDTIVRYIERGLGHIFETDMSDPLTEKTISLEDHLKVYEAPWGAQGTAVIARDLSKTGDIRSYVINLGASSTATSTSTSTNATLGVTGGEFLPENITSLAVSAQDTNKIFFLTNIAGDYEGSTIPQSVVGTIHNLSSGREDAVFGSPFTEWLTQWPQKNIIALTTKPSGEVPGYLYFLNPNTGRMSKKMGDINGLTTLVAPDGNMVLYSESGMRKFDTLLYHSNNSTTESFPFVTLPEKCTWTSTTIVYCAVPKEIPQGIYPDIWYKGLTSFSDEIWKVDLATGETTKVLDFKEESGGEELDGINIAVDPDQQILAFMNKKDLTIWAYKLQTASSTAPTGPQE